MPSDQRKTQSRRSVVLLILASLQMLICEAQLLVHLWHKGSGQTGFDGYATSYLLPVLIAFPLVAAWTQRRHFQRWKEAGEISTVAAEGARVDAGIVLVITYVIVSVLAR